MLHRDLDLSDFVRSVFDWHDSMNTAIAPHLAIGRQITAIRRPAAEKQPVEPFVRRRRVRPPLGD
jgi:hypothetical protein